MFLTQVAYQDTMTVGVLLELYGLWTSKSLVEATRKVF